MNISTLLRSCGAPTGGFPQTPQRRAGIITSRIDVRWSRVSAHDQRHRRYDISRNFSIEAGTSEDSVAKGRGPPPPGDAAHRVDPGCTDITPPPPYPRRAAADQRRFGNRRIRRPPGGAYGRTSSGRGWSGLTATQALPRAFMQNGPTDHRPLTWTQPALRRAASLAVRRFREQDDASRGSARLAAPYNGMNVSLRRRLADGGSSTFNYTWRSRRHAGQVERGGNFTAAMYGGNTVLSIRSNRS